MCAATNRPICPDCGIPLVLRTGRFGGFYGCRNFPECDYTAACERKPFYESDSAPVDRKTREARKAAHSEFDKLWKQGTCSRSSAYSWLSGKLGLKSGECHIGLFNASQCSEVIRLVKARLSLA